MIDYKNIGARVRKARKEKGLTQEQLAEAVGVGVTHISHLETGAGTVSLKVFVAIVNYLGCSVDELLCNEITAARPLVDNWLANLVADCDPEDIKVIAAIVTTLKQELKKNKSTK